MLMIELFCLWMCFCCLVLRAGALSEVTRRASLPRSRESLAAEVDLSAGRNLNL